MALVCPEDTALPQLNFWFLLFLLSFCFVVVAFWLSLGEGGHRDVPFVDKHSTNLLSVL